MGRLGEGAPGYDARGGPGRRALGKAVAAALLCLLPACVDLGRAFPPLPDHKPPPPGRHLGADGLPTDWRARYKKLGPKARARFDDLEAERRQIALWMRRATAEETREDEERSDEIRRLERLLLGEPD